MIKKIAFTVYPVKNIARARKFYEETLGLTLSQEFADGRWIEYDLPQGGCLALSDMMQDVKPSATAGGSIALEVDDIVTFTKELKAKDVEFKADIFQSPVCKIAVIFDSEGNSLILHQLHQA